jgi:hypothetical protein
LSGCRTNFANGPQSSGLCCSLQQSFLPQGRPLAASGMSTFSLAAIPGLAREFGAI